MKNVYLVLLSKIWLFATIFLLVFGALWGMYYPGVKSFIVMLNIMNVLLYGCFILFRHKIDELIINIFSGDRVPELDCHYENEKIVGYIFVGITLILMTLLISLMLFNIPMYSMLIEEDGVVEYASMLFWLLASIFMLRSILVIRSHTLGSLNKNYVFSILLMMFFIVCGGEEISWGQRIFDINTPEFMAEINVQNEITLHNIGSISVFSNIFFMITVLFFVVLPFIYKRYPDVKTIAYMYSFPVINRFATYVFVLSLIIWCVIGVRFGTLGFHPFSFYEENYYTQMDDEVFEMLAAFSFFTFSVFDSIKRVKLA